MSSTDHLEHLCPVLMSGQPIVLLLGQDLWKSGTHADSVLKRAFQRANRHSTESADASFPQLLQADPLPEGFYEWLAETYSHQPEAPWMETVSRLSLNAVFTSSVDPAIARAFRTDGRDVDLVLSKGYEPPAPRSRQRLHLTYLFGRAGERSSDERPPRNTRELAQRRAVHANPLLSRILETTTTLGVLLVDGLTYGRDWLAIESLVGLLSAFSARQVYWFGWSTSDSSPEAEMLRELAAPSGPIVFVQERLSAALRSLELAHKIDLSRPRQLSSEGSVTIQGRILKIAPAARLKVSTAAAIVEDAWLAPLPPIGADASYAEFRRFHGQVEDARRLVEGLRRNFAIERTFERELRRRVTRALANAGREQEPVLIHGQSGSGKSLALARLAYLVREAGTFAVLIASRVTRVPTVEELDEFCFRAEKTGAPATLVVSDANAPVSRYRDLLKGFVSRGRRVVVVGSAYRIVGDGDDAATQSPDCLLEVPPELDSSELQALTELVTNGARVSWRASPSKVESRYLLPAVYRMLPEIRPRLAAGLAREASVAEDRLRDRGAKKSATVPKPTGALGEALLRAGLIEPKKLLSQQISEFLGAVSDAASEAIDFVMVPGKLDCPVPLSLLMRAISGTESQVDSDVLFSGIDLFRWSANDEDDILVHPRLRVEAELICARRLGTAHAEAEVALRLIDKSVPRAYGNSERRFVRDLIHRIGPDGPFGRRYARDYLELARALTRMRTDRGVNDPSLMLQESTFRRRVLRDSQVVPSIDPAEILEEARQVVDLALDEFCSNSRSIGRGLRRTCANLKVERAAIYGFRAVQRLKEGASLDEVWPYYEAARDSARTAVFAADSYFAIDVSLWGPDNLLANGRWGAEKRAELVADIRDGLDRVDPERLDADQRERFQERRVKVAQTMDDNALEKDALAELDQLGSRAGIFLQARAIGGSLRGSSTPTSEETHDANSMLAFMRGQYHKIRDDPRCLRYFLRGLWLVSSKSFLFGGERSPLPEKEETLYEILTLLDTLSNLEGALGDPQIEYLRAVLMWRLRREHSARDVWYSLSRETAFSDPRRVVRHHLWTGEGGRPRLFHGRVKSGNFSRGRARVQVEMINQEVELFQHDFPNLDLRQGAGVSGGFHIAFNFIGPMADPPRRRGVDR